MTHAEWNRRQHALHGNPVASQKRCAIITYNHTSLQGQGKLHRLCNRVRRLGEREDLLAYCAQETKLASRDHEAHMRVARKAKVVAAFAYGEAGTGGTCVLIPETAMAMSPDETFSEAVERVLSTARATAKGGFASLTTYIGDRKVKIASVYAPTQPRLRQRFYKSITPSVTKATILCGDYNCVLDPMHDLKRSSTLPYQNVGADELLDIVTKKELFDTHCHSLGDE